MKRFTLVLVALLVFATSGSAQTAAKQEGFDAAAIRSELAAKYNAFNGKLEEQTVALWDTYFLKSPNVGNMHEGHPEIGWETVHKGSLEFVKSKPEGEMKMEGLEYYPINGTTAWVRGKMVVTTNDRVMSANFFDSLIKTPEGWRVILSVVNPERKNDQG